MVPERRRKKSFAERGQPRGAGTWMVLARGRPQPGQAHIGELALAVVGPCWVLYTSGASRHGWTDWIGEVAFFWIRLPRRSGMANGVGVENCRRIACHPPVGRCSPTRQPLFLCWDEKEEMGEEVPAIVRPGRYPTGFAGPHFPLATGSPVCAIRPSARPAHLVLFPSLGAKGGTGLQGIGSLDC